MGCKSTTSVKLHGKKLYNKYRKKIQIIFRYVLFVRVTDAKIWSPK